MGVESCGSGVSLGPQLEQQQCNESDRERRFSPRLVGYCVILGYGLECASLLYFKGEVILRYVFDGVKTVKELRPLVWGGRRDVYNVGNNPRHRC